MIIIVLFLSIIGSAQQALTYDETVMKSDSLFSENKINKNKETINSQLYKEDRYLEIIDLADNLFKKFKFDDALNEYQYALEIFPTDSYAQGKINRIREIQKDQDEYSEDFNRLMSDGVTLLEENQFIDAIKSFKKAGKLMPNKNEPEIYIANTKAAKVTFDNKLIAYTNEIELANSFIEAEDYVEALNHLNSAISISPNAWAVKNEIKYYKPLAEKQLENNKIIEKDNDQFKSQLVNVDIGNYKISIPPDDYVIEQIEVSKIKSHNKTSLDLSTENTDHKTNMSNINILVNKNNEQVDIQHDVYIAEGDSLLNLNLFEKSTVVYNKALMLKPDDSLAHQKLHDVKLQKSKYEEAIVLQKTYDAYIVEADSLFSEEKYSQSRPYYEKALSLKAEETYAYNQITEINRIIAKIEAETLQKYKIAISTADNYYNNNNLAEAVIKYKIATILKPDESYPQDKITEIFIIIEETKRKVQNKYNLAIATADKLYAINICDKAIESYKDASIILPEEEYPKEMILKIITMMEENVIVDILNHSITINSDTTRKFTFEPVSVNIRRSNYLFVKATNINGNPFKLIVSYGSDKGKNGGFVVQVPTGYEKNDYVIRVGHHYKWFSDNNNWISIHPEKGDIEISMIRISKSN